MAFDYPRNPDGLEPDTLFLDSLCHAVRRMAAETPPELERRPPTRPAIPGRTSRYVGVVFYGNDQRKRWRARSESSGRIGTGPTRPYTDEGELAAAWDYARLRGLPEPRMKEGRS